MNGRRLVAICALALLFPSVALAQGATSGGGGNGIGLRILGGIDPDQFGAGVQARVGRVAGGRFAPSIDLGFGDDLTTLCFNGDVLWTLELPGSEAGFYLGGGPTLTYWDPSAGDGDLEIGISFVGGIGLPLGTSHRYNLEARIGAGDVPDLRFAFGMLLGG